MNKILLLSFFIVSIFGCKNESQETTESETYITAYDSTSLSKDSTEVLNLIKKVMTWTDSKDQIGTLPLKGNASNICIGVDHELQKENLKKLETSNYFTTSFISNYKKIVDRFDEMIKNDEVEKFDIAEMAPFSFSTDANPWCNCQDNFGWDKIIAKEFKLVENTCEIKWGWNEWKDYSYKVKLKKENGVWKIEEMEGFDYKEVTKIF